jgi:hypothetical protein
VQFLGEDERHNEFRKAELPALVTAGASIKEVGERSGNR